MFAQIVFDKTIKEWMFEYVKVVSQLSNVVKWNKDSDDTESINCKRKREKYYKLC